MMITIYVCDLYSIQLNIMITDRLKKKTRYIVENNFYLATYKFIYSKNRSSAWTILIY